MKNYEEWFSKFKANIASYDFYVDFNKVYKNASELKIELNILNSLVGSKNIEQDFIKIVEKYPETLKCIPIFIAKREKTLFCNDKDNSFNFDFRNMNYSINDYVLFMHKTGLFDLIKNNIVGNLYDYVLGVEVGLDSNSRKNRSGKLMENLVEEHIKNAGFVKNSTYFKEMKLSELKTKIGNKLVELHNLIGLIKKFDYIILGKENIYLCECNFYTTNGSKLNETARSYKSLSQNINKINGLKFVWFTDGLGWKESKKILKETFDVLEDIYNIHELENGIINKKIK